MIPPEEWLHLCIPYHSEGTDIGYFLLPVCVSKQTLYTFFPFCGRGGESLVLSGAFNHEGEINRLGCSVVALRSLLRGRLREVSSLIGRPENRLLSMINLQWYVFVLDH